MSLLDWIVDFVVFFREIIVLAIIAYVWFRLTGGRSDEDVYYYDDDEYEDSYTQSHLSDEPLYQNNNGQQGQREYHSPGDFLVNGRLSDFDHENIHHRQAADSLDPYRR